MVCLDGDQLNDIENAVSGDYHGPFFGNICSGVLLNVGICLRFCSFYNITCKY